MRHTIFSLFIVSIFLTFSCTQNSIDEIKSNNHNEEAVDHFRMDSINFGEFMSQAIEGGKESNVMVAQVGQVVKDSIILDSINNTKLLFGVWFTLVNNNRHDNLMFAYRKNNEIVKSDYTDKFRYILEAMKQMNNKMSYTPDCFTSLYFNDNNKIEIKCRINPEIEPNWSTYIYINKIDSIKLSKENMDSLIVRLDKIKNYISR